jgi:ADP-heptose:LPS heptosyltransferase
MIRGANGVARWHDLWQGIPYIFGPHDTGASDSVMNGPNARPYIAAKSSMQWTWKEFRPPPGEIVLSTQHKDFGRLYSGRIVFEPHIKARASPNKRWPWVSWNKLAWILQGRGLRVTQIGQIGTTLLEQVDFVETKDFRHAVAILAGARAAVVHEGALHHAAAALGIPTVVLRGGFISPRVTGYEGQIDFFVGEDLGCGMRVPCQHCHAAMARIKPEQVAERVLDALREK